MAKPSHLRYLAGFAAAKLTREDGAIAPPRDMVLRLDDLPDGWRSRGSREFRTGMAGGGEEWAARVRAAKGRSLVASYQFGKDLWTWVISQAIPLVSPDDAATAFPSVFERMLANPEGGVVLRSRDVIVLPAAPGDEHRCELLTTENIRYPDTVGESYSLPGAAGASSPG